MDIPGTAYSEILAYCIQRGQQQYQRESIFGDPRGTRQSSDPDSGSCSLNNPKVVEAEKALVARIIDSVNDFGTMSFLNWPTRNYYNLEWSWAWPGLCT